MSRVAGFLNKALPGVGAVMDYAGGKAQGEDDIRAGAGAIGSGLGGWGGAVKGAAIGTMIAPGIGTAIGGIGGGIAGSLAGGWAADRLDETVRGKPAQANTGVKNNMSNVVQTQDGRLAEVDDDGNFLSWVVPATALGIAGDGLYRVGREAATNFDWEKTALDMANPSGAGRFNNTAAAQQTLGNARQIAGQGLRNTGDDIARVWNKIPGNSAVKGTALAAFALDQMTGGNVANAIGRGIAGGADMIANTLGFNTDFDKRNQVSQQAMREDREMNRVEQNRDIFNPYNLAQEEVLDRMLEKGEAYDNRLFERNLKAKKEWADKSDEVSRRNFLTSFSANQANALLKGYMRDIPNSVNNALNTVIRARYN